MRSTPHPLSTYLPAFCWLAISMYLFTIPGTSLPKRNWMDELQVDKWVHMFIFSVLIILFSRPTLMGIATFSRNVLNWWLPLAGAAYGVLVEFVQLNFIPNRGFEIWDIAADAAGCIAGVWLAPRLIRPR